MEIYLLTSSSPGLFIGKISTSGFSHLNRASVNRNFSLVLPSSEIWIYFLQLKHTNFHHKDKDKKSFKMFYG